MSKNNEATQMPKTIPLDEVQELEVATVKGNFRGGFRTCPEREVNGVKYPARTQFKVSRRVKLTDGRIIKQTAWIPEADAKAWGLQEGVKYAFVFEAGTEMTPSSGNGRDPQYLDEYALYDATIVSINGQTTPPLK